MNLPFATVGPADWGDWPLYIVGGGPSLAGRDLSRLRETGRVLAVNRAAFLIPCDAMVTLDQTFARKFGADIAGEVASGVEAYLTMPPNETAPIIAGATYLLRVRGPGLARQPDRLHGVNSGFAALNLGYLKGAREIALLGFDMQYDREGETHFHGGYEWHNKSAGKWMHRWGGDFRQAAHQLEDAGVSVTNFVGPQGSKVVGIRQRPLEDVL